jgi:hypothetical protein
MPLPDENTLQRLVIEFVADMVKKNLFYVTQEGAFRIPLPVTPTQIYKEIKPFLRLNEHRYSDVEVKELDIVLASKNIVMNLFLQEYLLRIVDELKGLDAAGPELSSKETINAKSAQIN